MSNVEDVQAYYVRRFTGILIEQFAQEIREQSKQVAGNIAEDCELEHHAVLRHTVAEAIASEMARFFSAGLPLSMWDEAVVEEVLQTQDKATERSTQEIA